MVHLIQTQSEVYYKIYGEVCIPLHVNNITEVWLRHKKNSMYLSEIGNQSTKEQYNEKAAF